jgi:alkylation response protein AidB-like acyl-CoA dehydrogenase
VELLARERETLERYLPGLDKALAEVPLGDLESPGNPAIRLFRESGGAALLVPKHYSGKGAGALDAARVTRALGTRSPSLVVATTMHQFSVATLVAVDAGSEGLEGLFLQAVAEQGLLLASGFAEGQPGQNILSPVMSAKRADKGVIVNGSKKPCSLSRSMDLLTASLAVPSESGDGVDLLVALIPASTPGIELRPFWDSPMLAGAESDEVVLNDVFVSDKLLFPGGDNSQLDPIQLTGFLWFELLVAAGYVGVASALVERVIKRKRGAPIERCQLGIEVESAMAAIEGIARAMDSGEATDDEALARLLFVRYAVQRSIERVGDLAVELLGGIAFSTSSEGTYLLGASRGLALHPPPRTRTAQSLAGYLAGEPLSLA